LLIFLLFVDCFVDCLSVVGVGVTSFVGVVIGFIDFISFFSFCHYYFTTPTTYSHLLLLWLSVVGISIVYNKKYYRSVGRVVDK